MNRPLVHIAIAKRSKPKGRICGHPGCMNRSRKRALCRTHAGPSRRTKRRPRRAAIDPWEDQ